MEYENSIAFILVVSPPTLDTVGKRLTMRLPQKVRMRTGKPEATAYMANPRIPL